MDRAELIEKLKHNERPFGLLSNIEKELLTQLKYKHFVNMFFDGDWISGLSLNMYSKLELDVTYRIDPDYTEPQPEAEYEIEKVVKQNEHYAYFCEKNCCYRDLSGAVSVVGFAGVQFLGQRHEDVWYMGISSFIESDGIVWTSSNNESETKPATPARVRFLRGE